MKFRYPLTVITISIVTIASIVLYGTLTKAEYNETASFIATLFAIAIQASIYWIIAIIIWNIIQAIKKLVTRLSTKEAEELERQREIERKEIDMVRKSNEILLHLIQDEHREKDR